MSSLGIMAISQSRELRNLDLNNSSVSLLGCFTCSYCCYLQNGYNALTLEKMRKLGWAVLSTVYMYNIDVIINITIY